MAVLEMFYFKVFIIFSKARINGKGTHFNPVALL